MAKKLAVSALLLRIVVFVALPHGLAQTPEPTATLIPRAFSVEEWYDLLTPDDACQLPCFFGLTPGISKSEDVLDLMPGSTRVFPEPSRWSEFDSISARFSATILDGATEEGPVVTLYLYFVDNTIDNILAFIPGASEEVIFDAWRYYDISNMLEIYGPPDSIRFVMRTDTEEPVIHRMILGWQDVGISIRYDNDADAVLCFDMDHLIGATLYLQPLESEEPIEQLWRIEDIPSRTQPLERFNTMSIEEFAQVMIDNQGCIPDDFFEQ